MQMVMRMMVHGISGDGVIIIIVFVVAAAAVVALVTTAAVGSKMFNVNLFMYLSLLFI